MKEIKEWFLATGLTNAAYLGGGIVASIFGFTLIAGACYGIFGYVNYNVISKIVRDKINDIGD